MATQTTVQRLSTGVEGLDEVLDGGLLPDRAYMLRGQPGTGKTVLGLQYLTAGTRRDETALCVNFEEPTENIRRNAASLGIDVSNVAFLDLSPDADVFVENQSYDVFAPDEVESTDVTRAIMDAVDEHDPDRVFVDPVTQLRHFTPDDYQFRKEVASFMSYLTGHDATVLFSTQPTEDEPDDDLQFVCDGTIELGRAPKGRTVEVTKFRGSDFADGAHTIRIDDGGLDVFPRLVPDDHVTEFEGEIVTSGIEGLDEMLNGGIERGATTVIAGPSGVGKTTTGAEFATQAAKRGERSAIYLFEENEGTFRHRSTAVGMPIEQMREQDTLTIEEIEPVSISPDEFAERVRAEVEERETSIVMIDGISGYRLSIRGNDDDLVRELHSLCRYLKNQGVTVILIDDTKSVTGEFEVTSSRISYLADNIMFLRYLEHRGRLKKAAGVLKKRASDFERALREFEITDYGIEIGDPMTGLQGVLTGTPEWRDIEGNEPERPNTGAD